MGSVIPFSGVIEPVGPIRRAAWLVFDGAWYLRRTPDAAARMQALGITEAERFYLEHGAGLGHSPNMFFDEMWYLRQNPDVAAFAAAGGFPSGFAHYCHDGWRARSPHWLFSERFCLSLYPEITRGLLVRHGAAERRRTHADIDLLHYASSGRVQADLEAGALRDPFAHWLSRLATGTLGHTIQPVAEPQSKQLFGRAAESMLPQLARRTINFALSDAQVPALSVIIVLHNQFALTMMALAPRSSSAAPTIHKPSPMR